MSSTCTALYVKNRNDSDFKEKYPAAARVIEKNHYMDDYITSFPTEKEAKEVSKSVDYIHRQAGFELCGWVSNTNSVVQQFSANSGGATVSIGGSEVRWYNGPSFLRNHEREWPQETKTEAPKTGEERGLVTSPTSDLTTLTYLESSDFRRSHFCYELRCACYSSSIYVERRKMKQYWLRSANERKKTIKTTLIQRLIRKHARTRHRT